MIWYHYWVSEVKWFRENRTPCSRCWFMWPTRDPFSKINPRAIPGPIIHVRLKICRNSSILWIRVIVIKKKQRLPGACNRSPGSKVLSITTQLHCGGHLGGRVQLPDTILKVYYPRTIHAMFALNWLTGFRAEDF